MKCTVNEEEATGTIYDVERTKYYEKKGLQNEFSLAMVFTLNVIAGSQRQKYLKRALLTMSRAKGIDSVMAAKLLVLGSASISKLERTQANVITARPELRKKTSQQPNSVPCLKPSIKV